MLASFANAALLTSDGTFIAGLMANYTRNAGMICFPCGSPDPDDVVGGRVNFETSVRRELEEETGLKGAELVWSESWYGVYTSQRFPLFKIVRTSETATTIRDRIRAKLVTQKQPEFIEIYPIRGTADIRPAMPVWLKLFLEYCWR